MTREQLTLTSLARAGFVDLGKAGVRLEELSDLSALPAETLLASFAVSAEPDSALTEALTLLRRVPDKVRPFFERASDAQRILRVIGASSGLAEFFVRQPAELACLATPVETLPTADELRADLLDAVGATDGLAELVDEEAWTRLRVRYRRRLAQIASYDLEQSDPVDGLDAVAETLSDLAAAAIEASLAVARRMTSGSGPGRFPEAEVRATRFAVIGMGKAGARELNYVSDVDVIFVAEGDEAAGVSSGRAVDIATRLAVVMMRGIDAPALESEPRSPQLRHARPPYARSR